MKATLDLWLGHVNTSTDFRTKSLIFCLLLIEDRMLGGVTVRTLDLRWRGLRGRAFDSRSGRYQVLTSWMGDCLQAGKPPRYITNTKVNSAFHPSRIGKSSKWPAWPGLRPGVFTCVGWQVTLCDPTWQVTLRSSAMGFPWREHSYTPSNLYNRFPLCRLTFHQFSILCSIQLNVVCSYVSMF